MAPRASAGPAGVGCVGAYLEQPLEAALLHGLRRQDVGQLGVGVGHQEARRHELADELCDPSF